MRRNLSRHKLSSPKVNRRLAREARVTTDRNDRIKVATTRAAVAALRAASQELATLLESDSSFRRIIAQTNAAPSEETLIPANKMRPPRPATKRSATLTSSLKRRAAAALLPASNQSRTRRKAESLKERGGSTVKPRLELLETARRKQKTFGGQLKPPQAAPGKPLPVILRKSTNGDAIKNSVAPAKPGQKIEGCRLAESRAAWVLEQSASLGRKITDTDMAGVLDAWSFRENKARTNVMPRGKSFVHSEMLGLVRIRAFSKYVVAKSTHKFPLVTRLLCRFLEDNPPKGLNHRMRFPYTTVCINRDYAAKRHRDRNNMGMSVVRAFGNFTGGRLRYWPDDPGASMAPDPETLDAKSGVPLIVKGRSVVVDSTKAHEVEAFQGRRYSLVYFTIPNYQKCSQEAKEWLSKECEVPLPKNPEKDQETWRQAAAGQTRRQRAPWQMQESNNKTQQRRTQQREKQQQQPEQQEQQGAPSQLEID
mmetsp:Transcript_107185/g.212772  ORF Transcript_107185/g.212772 Transcript_107185/m.212772 type:complete len:480 (-) Transcript_107185:220-1659(-)